MTDHPHNCLTTYRRNITIPRALTRLQWLDGIVTILLSLETKIDPQFICSRQITTVQNVTQLCHYITSSAWNSIEPYCSSYPTCNVTSSRADIGQLRQYCETDGPNNIACNLADSYFDALNHNKLIIATPYIIIAIGTAIFLGLTICKYLLKLEKKENLSAASNQEELLERRVPTGQYSDTDSSISELTTPESGSSFSSGGSRLWLTPYGNHLSGRRTPINSAVNHLN